MLCTTLWKKQQLFEFLYVFSSDHSFFYNTRRNLEKQEEKDLVPFPFTLLMWSEQPAFDVLEVMYELPVYSEVKQQTPVSVVRKVNCVSWVHTLVFLN